MTLRQSIAGRVAQDGLFAQVHSDIKSAGLDAIRNVVIEQTIVGVSKPQADVIAAGCGARPLWRNGYYMAARDFGQVRIELHFIPLITSDENATTDGNEQ